MVVSSSHWRHLVGRFFGALSAQVDSGRLRSADEYLSPGERALFQTMRVADQRHSLDLCRRLHQDGHTRPDLLRAALLHDVGKAAGSLPLSHRVVYSLAAVFLPALADWLGRPNPASWRRPFYLAAQHPAIGARAAARAGCNPVVVELIRGHASPGRDTLSRILYDYDRGM